MAAGWRREATTVRSVSGILWTPIPHANRFGSAGMTARSADWRSARTAHGLVAAAQTESFASGVGRQKAVVQAPYSAAASMALSKHSRLVPMVTGWCLVRKTATYVSGSYLPQDRLRRLARSENRKGRSQGFNSALKGPLARDGADTRLGQPSRPWARHPRENSIVGPIS